MFWKNNLIKYYTINYYIKLKTFPKMTDVNIEWPWQYSFPPFFSLQPHNETRSRQIAAWKSLIIEYFKATKQSTLDVNEATNLPVFNNTAINRKLNASALLTILSDLQSSGNAAPTDKHKTIWDIYWHTLDEWANILYNYITANGATNTVFTIYELTQGDDVQNEEFYGLDANVLIKILRTLEAQGKCEVMLFDDQQGVKFF